MYKKPSKKSEKTQIDKKVVQEKLTDQLLDEVSGGRKQHCVEYFLKSNPKITILVCK